MILIPIVLTVGLSIVSCIIGYPLALYFVGGREEENGGGTRQARLILLSVLLGYSALNLLVFTTSIAFSIGTRSLVIPVALVLVMVSSIVLFLRKDDTLAFFKSSPLRWIAWSLLFTLASFHVLWPVVEGRWLMAYATGDDGARWLMVVDYFQHHAFAYGTSTAESLRLNLSERPLYDYAGAVVASLFRIDSPLAYSVMSGFSAVLSTAAFCLLFESLFSLTSQRDRAVLWITAIIFFGFSGLLANQFYTGYATHHFSMYPVLSSFAFLAVAKRPVKRFLWIALWGVLNALYYTNRYGLYVLFCIAIMLLFEAMQEKSTLKSVAIGLGMVLLALVVVLLATLPESRVLWDAIRSGSTSGFTLQKSASYYGGDWSLAEKVLKYFGYLFYYDSIAGNLAGRTMLLFSAVVVFFLAAVYTATVRAARNIAYAGLFWANAVQGIALVLTGSSYVMYKSALYWSPLIVLGVIAVSLKMLAADSSKKRILGLSLLCLLLGTGILAGGRVLGIYWEMVDQRYTKVDALVENMRDTIRSSALQSQIGDSARIFSFDYGAERTPLMRHVLREFRWQPVRGMGLEFADDIISSNKKQYDLYHYDYLLYASLFNGPFDFSGNISSRIFSGGPFEVFGARSGLVEFQSGVEFKLFRWGESGSPHQYSLMCTSDTARAIFVNNGAHDWLLIEFASKDSLLAPGSVRVELFSRDSLGRKAGRRYRANIVAAQGRLSAREDDLRTERLTEVVITRALPGPPAYITRIVWGYDGTSAFH